MYYVTNELDLYNVLTVIKNEKFSKTIVSIKKKNNIITFKNFIIKTISKYFQKRFFFNAKDYNLEHFFYFYKELYDIISYVSSLDKILIIIYNFHYFSNSRQLKLRELLEICKKKIHFIITTESISQINECIFSRFVSIKIKSITKFCLNLRIFEYLEFIFQTIQIQIVFNLFRNYYAYSFRDQKRFIKVLHKDKLIDVKYYRFNYNKKFFFCKNNILIERKHESKKKKSSLFIFKKRFNCIVLVENSIICKNNLNFSYKSKSN
ncbi:hypothetical protein (nucleomorph) [Guillardia theta]|uniref:Uncharacterized protein n=1 Tax=Guillardia theta TaxID=55529 RepID=Q98SC9_GUITH|nr:hypothetical protein GTHECHR3151 [Guillardia theta]AAK39787.1 hypothetical protein [Guillardia theta]